LEVAPLSRLVTVIRCQTIKNLLTISGKRNLFNCGKYLYAMAPPNIFCYLAQEKSGE
jgi:hypothetical protein